MRLTEGDRDKAKQLLRLLGLKQNEFCKKYKILDSTLSSALRGKRSIPEETWGRVLDGFGEDLRRKKQGERGPETLTAQMLLDDLSGSAGREPTSTTPLPGGPLPIGATTYIQRKCDTDIEALLNSGSLFTVRGAPRSGRSSLLLQLNNWAEEKLKFASVAFVDLNTFLPNLRSITVMELLTEVAAAAGLNIADAPNPLEAGKICAQQIIAAPGRKLLILDSVDNAVMQDRDKTWTILLFLLNIRIHLALHAPRKFVAVTVFGAEAWSAYYKSAFVTSAISVETSCFSKRQIADLAKIVTGKTGSNDNIERVNSLFGGHPYLTHLFFEDVRRGKSLDEIAGSALALHGSYGLHAERIVQRLKQLTSDEFNESQRGSEFPRLCKQIVDLGSEQDLIFRYEGWLQLLGIKEPDNSSVCELYRRAFERASKL
jgi:hypothetical protein